MPRRLRGVIDQLQRRANEVMDEAESSLSLADKLLIELMDGVTFELVNEGEGSLWSFIMDRQKVYPIKVRLIIEEKDE